jgi:phosphoribosylanthranilate isomerase
VRVSVKICGITDPGDARAAVQVGADFLGFVFYPASRRHVGEAAVSWIRRVSGAPTVGVFLDQDPEFIRRVRKAARLSFIQLHGGESPELCAKLGGREKVIKAIPVGGRMDWGLMRAYGQVARVLFDTASPTGGGTGRPFDWRVLASAPADLGFWLAGGLRATNVARALVQANPAGVDVASGVEDALGRKDPDKMRRFVEAVRAVDGSKIV